MSKGLSGQPRPAPGQSLPTQSGSGTNQAASGSARSSQAQPNLARASLGQPGQWKAMIRPARAKTKYKPEPVRNKHDNYQGHDLY